MSRKKSLLEVIANDMEHVERNAKRINARKIPLCMVGSRIKHVFDCKGPIPCTSITFENGWRLDIDRTGEIQCITPKENPYYDRKTKKHKIPK